jgi:transcriptional regulator with XRE-family HTH domain
MMIEGDVMPLRSDRLRALRETSGYTLEDLADRLRITSRQIARYEADQSDPASDVLLRIARLFGVTSDYLLGLTDSPNREIRMSELSDDEQNLIAAYRQKRAAVLLEAATRIVQDQEQSRVAPLKPAANS